MNNNIFISHGSVFYSEYVGSVFFLLSSSFYDNKLRVLKSNTNDLLLLSNERFFWHSLYHLHREIVSSKGFFFFFSCFNFSDIKYLNFSIFIQYSYFSQLEWRYIRYFFFRLSFKLTVIHSDFFDLSFRFRNVFFSLSNVFSGHQFLLRSFINSLNIFSFFLSLNTLYLFFFRSRDIENHLINDFFYDYNDNISYIEQHDSYFSDYYMDLHFNVEQQLTASGFFFYGSVFQFGSVFFLSSLSFYNVYFFFSNFFFFFSFIFFFYFSYIYFFLSLFFFSFSFFYFSFFYKRFSIYFL